jgi:hypothetical protein
MKRIPFKLLFSVLVFMFVSNFCASGQTGKKDLTLGEAIHGTYKFLVGKYDSNAPDHNISVLVGNLTIQKGKYNFVPESIRNSVQDLPKFCFLDDSSGTYTFSWYKKELSENTPVSSLEDDDILGTITMISKDQKKTNGDMVSAWFIRIDLHAGYVYFHSLINEFQTWSITKKY